MPYYLEMKKMMRISNPLLKNVFVTRESQVNLDEKHTFVSESDALELQLYKTYKGSINTLDGVPLKIQFGQSISGVRVTDMYLSLALGQLIIFRELVKI